MSELNSVDSPEPGVVPGHEPVENPSDEDQKPAKKSVVVLYNHVGEDWYEKLKAVDVSKLPFKPEYPIGDVATIKEEYDEIVKALRRAGYRARAVNIKDDLKRLERVLRRNPPDVIFNLVEHFKDDPGLEPSIAGLIDLHQIAYTGTAPFGLELCMDKWHTKQILQANRIPTPRYLVVQGEKLPKRLRLQFPLIIKPAWEDASAGVRKTSVVQNIEELAERLPAIYREFEQPILLEEFIEGRELHVSIWGNEDPEMLPPIEYDFSDLPPDHPPLITYATKWDPLDEAYHKTHTICPVDLPKKLLRKVERVAIHAYEVTYCRDYARLDIRLKDDVPYVLEVNPNPDLTESVSFMESAEEAGWDFDSALARIVEMAFKRKPVPRTPKAPSDEIRSLEAFTRGDAPPSTRASVEDAAVTPPESERKAQP